MCSSVFSVFAGFCGHADKKAHLHCFNSYNWPFEDKHSADIALSENEFDNLLQQGFPTFFLPCTPSAFRQMSMYPYSISTA